MDALKEIMARRSIRSYSGVPLSLVPVGYPNESKPPHHRNEEERVHREWWQVICGTVIGGWGR
jgi:nitroreductase